MAQLLNGDEKMMTDDKEKAEVLNSYFSSVSSHRTAYEPPEKCEVWEEGTGLQLEIDKQIVNFSSLNEVQSPGPDELHVRVLKELTEEL